MALCPTYGTEQPTASIEQHRDTTLTAAETERLTRRGLRLAQFTVAYNVIEGAVAITVGLLAGLVSVVGFGIDSGIESIAAVLVGLRLAARLRHGHADEPRSAAPSSWSPVTFFLLAAYVIIEGIRSLLGGEEPESSPVGHRAAGRVDHRHAGARRRRRRGSGPGSETT